VDTNATAYCHIAKAHTLTTAGAERRIVLHGRTYDEAHRKLDELQAKHCQGVRWPDQRPLISLGVSASCTPVELGTTATLPCMTPEVEHLRAALDGLRAGVLKKLVGLSDQNARRSTVDSGTNLAGLIQHLTFVESKWFEEIVAGGKAARGNRSMRVDPSVSARTLRAEYRTACAASNEIIAAVGDADAPVTRNGQTRNLRWVLLAVIEETARHAGHADIIREQIDGQTGR
jgi:hypothetical protein